MTQELITQDHQQQGVPATFQRSTGLSANVNQGAIAIEQERAIAEAQGKLILAKKFTRDENRAHDQLMKACSVRAFAETAFYSVPNRGSGPSIRFAEEVARVYGNFEYGHRELSRGDGKSEVEVFAWDMENNNFSKRQITVLHVVDTRNGPRKLTDQADIDNKIANVASKQMRGRILALMPKWMVAEAIERCKQTLAGTVDEPLEARVRKMTQAFSKFGVTVNMLEAYLGHALSETNVDELVDMTGIYNALKEGGKVADYFSNKEAEAEASAATANKLAEAAKAGAAAGPKRQRREQPVSEPPAQEPPPAAESKPAENDSTPAEDSQPAVNNSPAAEATEEDALF